MRFFLSFFCADDETRTQALMMTRRYTTLQLRYITLQLRYIATIILFEHYLRLYREHQILIIFN